MNSHYEDIRPWGKFEVLLEESNYKVKRITVKPKQRLSLQYHNKRSEVWVVVCGTGIITRNDQKIKCKAGDFVDIPVTALHRVENNSETDFIFIEVQTGSYLGEDDIVRIEDDYSRTESTK